ncbi:MAG: thioredoxin [bacterium]
MVMIATTQNFEQEILKSPQPAVVDFFATWCGPCKMMSPVLDEVAAELWTKYKFAKVNIDEEREIAVKHNVSSIPTFLFIKDGVVVGRETGFMSKDTLKSKIQSYFEK